MKTVILTEKPSVARDFANALQINQRNDGYFANKEFAVTWAFGHLLELADPEIYDPKWKRWSLPLLPILPTTFQYRPVTANKKQLGVIKRLIKSAHNVIIATDAGREGELIARTILNDCPCKVPIKRFWTSQALTPAVITSMMAKLKPAAEFDRLYYAGSARQQADWLVGINLTRAATRLLGELYSVGRVQTAVLALLSDRRQLRDNFNPIPFWQLRANFENGNGAWQGLWFEKRDGEEISRIDDETTAKTLQQKCFGKSGRVKSLQKKKRHQASPPLYSLTELQRDSNRFFGLSAKKTLEVAQALYERRKCLSYPRSDSEVLGTDSLPLVKKIITVLGPLHKDLFENIHSKRIHTSNKLVFNDSKLTDHHALIPLAPLPRGCSHDETRVFDLVLRRFSSVFHSDWLYQTTTLITHIEDALFRSRGIITTDLGWRRTELKDNKSKDTFLPTLEKGDTAAVTDLTLDNKQTTPLPEYTDALLLTDMKAPARLVADRDLKAIYRGDIGIGTSATRAAIIETLLARKYAKREKRHLIATTKGCHLVSRIRELGLVAQLASAEETARWELALEEIAQGNRNSDQFMTGIREFVSAGVNAFKKAQPRPSYGACPDCKNGVVIEGKHSFGCALWHSGCQFRIQKNQAEKTIGTADIPAILDQYRQTSAGTKQTACTT